jgi:hypothetical protein
MNRVNHWAVAGSAVASFVAGGLGYGLLFAKTWTTLASKGAGAASEMGPAQGIAQLVRDLLVAYVLARVFAEARVADWRGAVRLGLWVWFGFQAMAIAGGVIHEGYPLALYAIHVGDALIKTLLSSVILGIWTSRYARSVTRAASRLED